MQTFLPYPSFIESTKCLDRRRLGNQRREVLTILTALTNPGAGWQNHPAVKMWKGYGQALVVYGLQVCAEWINRGYNDNSMDKIMSYCNHQGAIDPPWLGDESFHSSHRAALLAKDPEWYGQFGWTERPEINYVWPV